MPPMESQNSQHESVSRQYVLDSIDKLDTLFIK